MGTVLDMRPGDAWRTFRANFERNLASPTKLSADQRIARARFGLGVTASIGAACVVLGAVDGNLGVWLVAASMWLLALMQLRHLRDARQPARAQPRPTKTGTNR